MRHALNGFFRVLFILTVVSTSVELVHAQEGPESLGIQMNTRTQVGGSKPALVLNPSYAVKRLSVSLKSTKTGRRIHLKSGSIRSGGKKTLSWKPFNRSGYYFAI